MNDPNTKKCNFKLIPEPIIELLFSSYLNSDEKIISHFKSCVVIRLKKLTKNG